jgi:hypothetical protein
MSKCPGETGTLKRESGVQILEIAHRCGPNKDKRCDGSQGYPQEGEWAFFGVRIINLSPTGRFHSYSHPLYSRTAFGQNTLQLTT